MAGVSPKTLLEGNRIFEEFKGILTEQFVCQHIISQSYNGFYWSPDNGKSEGIHPRWGKVWAIGPEQTDVAVGEWVLIEHGRWTRTVDVADGDSVLEVRMVDNNAILAVSDEPPSDVMYSLG
jgi:hypothetical protein